MLFFFTTREVDATNRIKLSVDVSGRVSFFQTRESTAETLPPSYIILFLSLRMIQCPLLPSLPGEAAKKISNMIPYTPRDCTAPIPVG